ncbi:acyl-CoA reductase-like NAD-dependent aldehyde dehydrogenase [Pseudarthrobacter sp. W1I19]|nr:acyl-CoA reductase-like NAD-dependent aldehyde dehydrogenase [Pseudarthrobacter sp. W1I19]
MADAVSKGARVLTGGTRPEGPGYFYTPTVLTDVPLNADLMSTEIFGPVAAITHFDSEDEVLRVANNTQRGLVGYVLTENMGKALRFSQELEVGMVGINTGLSPTRPHHSAALSSPDWDAKAAKSASKNSSSTNTPR